MEVNHILYYGKPVLNIFWTLIPASLIAYSAYKADFELF
jgi:hypothetical protein